MPTLFDLALDFHNWRHSVGKVRANLQKTAQPIRLGILSAANISYSAIIDPISTHPDVILSGIAARDISKARAQIAKYKLNHPSSGTGPECKAYAGYAALLADPSIDAVYIPVPNGLHAEWALKALEAGKHVLLEKPLTANAAEAQRIAAAVAANPSLVALEAFHWRFHPAAHHVRDLIASGTYGAVRRVSSRMVIPRGVVGNDDIRFQYALAGGASMDLTYVFSTTTYFATKGAFTGAYTFDVQDARARPHAQDKRVDEGMTADFTVSAAGDAAANSVHCHAEADLAVPPILGIIPRPSAIKAPALRIELDRATVEFNNFVIPTYGHSIVVTEKNANGGKGKVSTTKKYVGSSSWGEGVGEEWWTTYRYQLEAFVGMVRQKQQQPSSSEPRVEAQQSAKGSVFPAMGLDESVRLMQLIDAVYEKAGLPKRGE